MTGAFGYSGRYIARRLLDAGEQVITLTNSSVDREPFGSRVRAFPLDFSRTADLRRSLSGVSVLYNTYWVRFNHRAFTFAQAVKNSEVLFATARDAGVSRVVHVSITNPSLESPLEYFRGKAEVEKALRDSEVSHAILRPTVLFGKEDILINNIAYMLRRVPVFGVFGDGEYRLQPIFVEDLAKAAVDYGARPENVIIDAIGPETFTYRELVRVIGQAIGHKRRVISVPPSVGYRIAVALGKAVGDVIITRDEIRGLMDGLLCVDSPPLGETRLSEWATENGSELGVSYASELARRRVSKD